jgi:hypothetical protein
MSGGSPRGVVAPNFRAPRLIGIFSVVFASELLIVGLCLGGYVSILPTLGRLMDASQKQLDAQAAASKKAELGALAAREKEAKTEEQRTEIAVKRKEIETRPAFPMAAAMDVNRATMGDPTFIRYSWLDLLSGIALNVLMLASGIGLLTWRPWARTLGVWTAALKIVRLVLVYGFFILVIVPPYSRKLGKAVVEMMGSVQPIGGAPPAPFMDSNFFVKTYTIMYSGFGLGVMTLGAVFPAIVLWLLTRPAVKSACSGTLKTPKEPNQPC